MFSILSWQVDNAVKYHYDIYYTYIYIHMITQYHITGPWEGYQTDLGPSYWTPGTWCNINVSSYQYRKSHCGDKAILQLSYLHNGIAYTGKMTPLYWISPWLTKDTLMPHSMGDLWNVFWRKLGVIIRFKCTPSSHHGLCLKFSPCFNVQLVSIWLPVGVYLTMYLTTSKCINTALWNTGTKSHTKW